jgi:hypothetical protein
MSKRDSMPSEERTVIQIMSEAKQHALYNHYLQVSRLSLIAGETR